MEALLHDARAAVRSLRHSPWFAAGVVATLAISIGATTLIFSVVNGVILKPLPLGNGARLVAVVAAPGANGDNDVSPPDFMDWRRQVSGLDAMATYRTYSRALTGSGG